MVGVIFVFKYQLIGEYSYIKQKKVSVKQMSRPKNSSKYIKYDEQIRSSLLQGKF